MKSALTDSTRERLLILEVRQADLRAMTPPEPAPRFHPGMAEIYRAQVARLEAALNDRLIRDEASEALRALIDSVVLYPGDKRGEVRAELYGQLGAILALGEAKQQNRTSEEVRFSVVAGTGFVQEPTIEMCL